MARGVSILLVLVWSAWIKNDWNQLTKYHEIRAWWLEVHQHHATLIYEILLRENDNSGPEKVWGANMRYEVVVETQKAYKLKKTSYILYKRLYREIISSPHPSLITSIVVDRWYLLYVFTSYNIIITVETKLSIFQKREVKRNFITDPNTL